MKEDFYICSHCGAVSNPTEVVYRDLYECHFQLYECPSCHNEDEDYIID